MTPGAAAVLGLRFVSELALLVSAGVAGWAVGERVATWLGVLLAVLAMVVVTTLWGLFVAPQSAARWRDPARMTLEVVLFGGTATVLAITARPWWGLALGVGGVALAVAARMAEPEVTAR